MLHGRACSRSGNLGRKDAVLVRHGWVCLGAISYVQPPCTVFHSMHPSASCFETFEILALVPALGVGKSNLVVGQKRLKG